MFQNLTAQCSLFDSHPGYTTPVYEVWFLNSRLPGLYSQHDVDAFALYDREGWRFKYRLARAPVPAVLYAYEG